MVYPYGVHIAAVRVDADTGGVTIERYAIAYDIGKAVNPKLVEGQIAGGLAQGVGGALLEEFLYDDNGEPLSVTFADYLMPTAREIPELSILVTEDAPSPLNPLGLKGAGEGGANPVGAVDRVRHRRRACTPRRGDAIAGLAAAAEGAMQKNLTMSSETKPQLKAPPGTCDTHIHIYDHRYPKAATAKILAPDAFVADYLRVRARLGIERTVVVQPSAYGIDNRCTLAAMAAIGPSARGVVVVDETVSDAELDRLTKLGIRGIRFFMLAGAPLPLEILETMSARVASFGWHIVFQMDGRNLAGAGGPARPAHQRAGDRSCRKISRTGAARSSGLSRRCCACSTAAAPG